MALITQYVNTDAASAGGDGSLGNPYKTLAEALTPFRLAGSISNAYRILCSGATADPGVSGLGSAYSLDHTAWEFVTSPTNYIEVVGDNTGRTWNATKYHVQVTNRAALYNQYAAHVRLKNVQIQVKVTDGIEYHCFRLSTANNDTTNGAGYFLFRNCISRRDPTSTLGRVNGFYNSILGAGSGDLDAVNCLHIGTVINTNDRGYSQADPAWADAHAKYYNCGVAKAQYGFETCWTKNSWGADCAFGFISPVTGSDYCAENDGNGIGGGGTHNKSAAVFTNAFVDAANGDYGLQSGDTVLEAAGLNNPGSGLFLDTLDGKTRNGTWSIGPTQFNATAPVSGHNSLMLLGLG